MAFTKARVHEYDFASPTSAKTAAAVVCPTAGASAAAGVVAASLSTRVFGTCQRE
jgi:hypothetical protein